MGLLLKITTESVLQAVQSLRYNKLRSFLSLLGISIGILCIIGVQAAVDSLEDNVIGSFDQLGSDVIYVSKFVWTEDPHANFMKLLRRPNPSYADYKVINKKVKSAAATSFNVFLGQKTLEYRSSNVERVAITAVTYDYADIYALDFEKGRYFSPQEYQYGANKVIIGHKVAEELFGAIEPIGKEIKVLGRKLEVIGVLAKSGDNLFNIMNYDESVLVSYELGKKIANLKSNFAFGNASISVKAADNTSVLKLKDDVTGVLRAHRRLKPKEESNFALNEISAIAQAFDPFFKALNLMGLVVGMFAIFVGVFSVANIMFVSVKERTNIIGIKKALGAKKYIILLEFLIEAIILCLIGGLLGLLLIYLLLTGLSNIESMPFDIYLSANNVINGLIWSTAIGIVAGIIPAFLAARMDPVDAIRSK